jgi:acetyl esterase
MEPTLDPQARSLLETIRASGSRQPYEIPIAEARAVMRAVFATNVNVVELYDVRDVALPTPYGSLAVRLFRPAAGELPLALFLHGGGWILHDLDTHDRLCRRIAKQSGWIVASLDYRRAPEHKHPAALEDAHLAYRWLLDNAESIGGDRATVALVGESAGATTAACLTLLLRDLGAPQPTHQILAYPVTGMFTDWPSHRERETGYTLDLEFVRWSLRNCISADQDLRDPYLLPLASSNFEGLPPALIMTAEFDPLRDEGIAYVERLIDAGVPVVHVHATDQMHGFLLYDRAIVKAGELIDQIAESLAGFTQC